MGEKYWETAVEMAREGWVRTEPAQILSLASVLALVMIQGLVTKG
jgi:hypothetical protein